MRRAKGARHAHAAIRTQAQTGEWFSRTATRRRYDKYTSSGMGQALLDANWYHVHNGDQIRIGTVDHPLPKRSLWTMPQREEEARAVGQPAAVGRAYNEERAAE